MKNVEKTILALVVTGGIAAAAAMVFMFGSGEEGGGATVRKSAAAPGREAREMPVTEAEAGAEQTAAERVAVRPEQAGEPAGSEKEAAAPSGKPAGRGAVTGRVTDAFGRPLQGAEILGHKDYGPGVILPASFEHPLFETRSDAQGRFRIEGVPGDQALRLLARSEGYVPRVLTVPAPGKEAVDVGEIRLEQGGSISGRVLDARGRPVASAEVKARPAGRAAAPPGLFILSTGAGEGGYTAHTDETGFYRITGLPAGKAGLLARHEAYVPRVRRDVRVEKGNETRGIDFTLPEGRFIEGQVVNASGKPVAGARVTVDVNVTLDLGELGGFLPELFETPETVTDGDGLFRLGGLEKERYTVRVYAQGFMPFAEKGVKTGTTAFTAVLEGGAWIGGRVLDARTGEGIADFDVKATQTWAGGPSVKVLKGKEAAVRLPGVVDPAGAFCVEGLHKGGFSLLVEAAGYAEARVENLSVPADSGKVLEVKLLEECVVAGKVLSAEGTPVAGAEVVLDAPRPSPGGGRMVRRLGARASPDGGDVDFFVPGNRALRVKSGKDGAFRIRGVPPGAYEVTARHPKYLDAEPKPVALGRGEKVEGIVLELGAAGSIAGTVYGLDGGPEAGARVTARKQGKVSFFETKSAVSGREGRYTLEGLSPGEYGVRLEDGGSGGVTGNFMVMMEDQVEIPGVHRVLVEAGKVTALDLYETPKAMISGYVRETGHAVEGMTVKLYPGRGFAFMPLKSSVTGRDGSYTFEALDPGAYAVKIELLGLSDPLEEQVTLDPGAAVSRDFDLPSGRVTGRVIDKGTREPIAGVEVILEKAPEAGEGGEEVTREIRMVMVTGTGGGGRSSITLMGGGAPPARTDEDGRYTIRYVKDGTYRVKASGAGYAEGVRDGVRVTEGRETPGCDLALQRGYVISGTLLDAVTGKALAFVPLSLVSVEEGPNERMENATTITTGEEGRFTYPDLAPGTYRLEVMSEKYEGSLPVEIVKEDHKDIQFFVKPR